MRRVPVDSSRTSLSRSARPSTRRSRHVGGLARPACGRRPATSPRRSIAARPRHAACRAPSSWGTGARPGSCGRDRPRPGGAAPRRGDLTARAARRAAAGRNPLRQSNSVVLPAPFGPMMPTISAGRDVDGHVDRARAARRRRPKRRHARKAAPDMDLYVKFAIWTCQRPVDRRPPRSTARCSRRAGSATSTARGCFRRCATTVPCRAPTWPRWPASPAPPSATSPTPDRQRAGRGARAARGRPASASRPGRCGSRRGAGLSAAAAITSGAFDVALDQRPRRRARRADGEFDPTADNDPELRDRLIRGPAAVMPADGPAALLGIGVAIPGVCDTERGVDPRLRPGPRRSAARGSCESLSRRFDQRVLVDNDARAQALGEKWFGEGRGVPSFASVQTGHGLGVGLVLDGVVYRGSAGEAGEVGHTAVALDGERCRCGLVGCWETIASLRWLRARGRTPATSAARRTLDARAARRRAPDVAPAAAELLDEYADHLAIGLANLVQLLTPPLLILHGDVVGGGEDLRGRIEAAVRARVLAVPARRRARRVVRTRPARRAAGRRRARALRDLQAGELMTTAKSGSGWPRSRRTCRSRSPASVRARELADARPRRPRGPRRRVRQRRTSRLCLLVFDLLGMSRDTSNAIRDAVAADLGIDDGRRPARVHPHPQRPQRDHRQRGAGLGDPAPTTPTRWWPPRAPRPRKRRPRLEPASLHFARAPAARRAVDQPPGAALRPVVRGRCGPPRRRLDRRRGRQRRRASREPRAHLAAGVGRLRRAVPRPRSKPASAATRCCSSRAWVTSIRRRNGGPMPGRPGVRRHRGAGPGHRRRRRRAARRAPRRSTATRPAATSRWITRAGRHHAARRARRRRRDARRRAGRVAARRADGRRRTRRAVPQAGQPDRRGAARPGAHRRRWRRSGRATSRCPFGEGYEETVSYGARGGRRHRRRARSRREYDDSPRHRRRHTGPQVVPAARARASASSARRSGPRSSRCSRAGRCSATTARTSSARTAAFEDAASPRTSAPRTRSRPRAAPPRCAPRWPRSASAAATRSSCPRSRSSPRSTRSSSAGAVPVFAEIDDTLNLDADRRREQDHRAHRPPIMPVHLENVACDMDALLAVAPRHGGSRCSRTPRSRSARRYNGRALGTIGDIGAFSLQLEKNITSGEGGVVVTDDDGCSQRAARYQDQGGQFFTSHGGGRGERAGRAVRGREPAHDRDRRRHRRRAADEARRPARRACAATRRASSTRSATSTGLQPRRLARSRRATAGRASRGSRRRGRSRQAVRRRAAAPSGVPAAQMYNG